MPKEWIHLSETGKVIFHEAVKKSREDLKKYDDHIRATFFYYDPQKKEVGFIELRDFIDEVIKENNLAFPFNRKESDYFLFANIKFFDILSIQLHRKHPGHYLVATQKDDGKIIFIVRDSEVSPSANMRVLWESLKLDSGKVDPVEFHLSRSQLM